MNENEVKELKQEYNGHLRRFHKAYSYLEDAMIPIGERDKWMPEYLNILNNLNRCINQFDIYKVEYSTKQIFGGFELTEMKQAG